MEFNISQQTEDNCNYLNDERSVQDPRRNVTLDFGRVPVGTTVTKSFKISNDCRVRNRSREFGEYFFIYIA